MTSTHDRPILQNLTHTTEFGSSLHMRRMVSGRAYNRLVPPAASGDIHRPRF